VQKLKVYQVEKSGVPEEGTGEFYFKAWFAFCSERSMNTG
jgi:hypothetical protein